MEISKELKESIKLAVITALDKHYQDKEIDSFIVDKVVGVLAKHEQGPGMVAVKYIGKRERYSDGIADTGWWDKGQTRLIPEEDAKKLLPFDTVYVPGDIDEATDTVQPAAKQEEDEQDRLEQTRDLVQSMTRKQQVQSFVSDNYNGLEIPAVFKSLPEMKQFATMQIDRYGII